MGHFRQQQRQEVQQLRRSAAGDREANRLGRGQQQGHRERPHCADHLRDRRPRPHHGRLARHHSRARQGQRPDRGHREEDPGDGQALHQRPADNHPRRLARQPGHVHVRRLAAGAGGRPQWPSQHRRRDQDRHHERRRRRRQDAPRRGDSVEARLCRREDEDPAGHRRQQASLGGAQGGKGLVRQPPDLQELAPRTGGNAGAH
mmetsp:Transcript_94698/g.289711  ORF Transcript_94698/g.289711 Transcript_94698/m.289711 type:complete len:203 (-) Transcript_94698:1273-1881(-)